MLYVGRSFQVFLFNLEKYSKNAYKFNHNHVLSFRTPKIVILILLILWGHVLARKNIKHTICSLFSEGFDLTLINKKIYNMLLAIFISWVVVLQFRWNFYGSLLGACMCYCNVIRIFWAPFIFIAIYAYALKINRKRQLNKCLC
jgi:hypothetical protein